MSDWHDRNLEPVLRWIIAAIAVVVAHGTGLWIALNWQPAQAAMGDPPAAIMVELAPVAVAPEAPDNNVAPGPQMVEAEPEPEPEPTPEPEEEVVAQPPLPPELPKPPPPKKREVEKKPRAPRTSAPTPAANRAERSTAPALGASAESNYSQASWRGALMSHLNRHKRYPSGASGSGTAAVAFSISRSGQVLSARLSRSSGDSALDQEAVAMVQRASPVPAPPSDMGGGSSIALNVPVRFNR